MNCLIKAMETEDEIRGKAYVHWKSWQETYAGIVDAGYLSRMTLDKCESRATLYQDNTWVAKVGERVVGFTAAGKYRGEDGRETDTGEVYAIYVLQEYQHQKIGYALMRFSLSQLSDCRTVCVWVLAENRNAVSFYEKLGFRADGAEKELMLGTPVKAIRMTIFNSEGGCTPC